MFKLRAISALVLLPLVVAAILYLPNIYLAIASAIVFGLGAIEWLNMTLIKPLLTRALLIILLAMVAFSLLRISTYSEWLYMLALAWWSLGLIGVCYYPRGANFWQYIFLQPFVGLLMFVPGWLAFNQLLTREHGPIWVLLGCALIWGADIGAYCFGKLWGKTKLVEKVSPGKTWAGFYGAIFSGCLIMLVFYYWYKPRFSLMHAIWLAMLTVIFAVIGDLVESMLKRIYGFKDSGKLIPGHGGVFDRIDSMLAAFPIYLLGLQNLFYLSIMEYYV